MIWDWLTTFWNRNTAKHDFDFVSELTKSKTSNLSTNLLIHKKNHVNSFKDFVNSSSLSSKLQNQILNISYDNCNCFTNGSLIGFNETTNSSRVTHSDQSNKSNYSITLQYLRNITDFSNHTNLNESLENFDILFYENSTSNFKNQNSTVIHETILFTNLYQQVFTAIILGVIILITIIGNVFVIAAILLEKNLQNVANHLILSLAVADLLVACLVMPIAALYQISELWIFGEEICDIWNQIDVLCCTASIFNLVAIALDRYWAVTSVHYHQKRTTKRILGMIIVLWILAFLVSIAPMLGLKDKGWQERIKNQQCIVSQDIRYQVFATLASNGMYNFGILFSQNMVFIFFAGFFLPLFLIVWLYGRIFLAARKRIRKKQNLNAEKIMKPVLAVTAPWRQLPTISEIGIETTTTVFTNLSSNTSPEKESFAGQNRRDNIVDDLPSCDAPSGFVGSPVKRIVRKKPLAATDSKRERKAAKTLGIITGIFIFCWSPFFILTLMMAISQYKQTTTNPYMNKTANIVEHLAHNNDLELDGFQKYQKLLSSIALWLGYLNSTANPIIYTIFSPEFRSAFKRLIFGRKNNRHQLGLKQRSNVKK